MSEATTLAPTHALSVPELAARVGVDPSTAYRYVAAGKLPGTKVGSRWLVDPARLERFLAGQEDAAGRPLLGQPPGNPPAPIAALPPPTAGDPAAGRRELLKVLGLLRATLDLVIGAVDAAGHAGEPGGERPAREFA